MSRLLSDFGRRLGFNSATFFRKTDAKLNPVIPVLNRQTSTRNIASPTRTPSALPMDLRKNLQEQDLAGLAEMCRGVARNHSSTYTQSDTAHRLRVEWVRLSFMHHNDKTDADQESLRKRMVEFLSGVPAWMLSGV